MNSTIWYRNGEWLDGVPFLSVEDAGFVYGAVITDRLRTFQHKPFRLEDHIHRLIRNCDVAHVPLAATHQEIVNVVEKLIHRNRANINSDFNIVLLATPGPSNAAGPPTLIAHAIPLDLSSYRPMFIRGAHLRIANVRQVSRNTLDPTIKHRSRLHWWMARQQVQQIDATSDALLLDEEGNITETASANVIVVKNQELLTPTSKSVLPGISLQTIREICPGAGLTWIETNLTPDDFMNADEILLTCSSWCMAGVSQFDGKPVPWPGPIFQRLAQQWSKRVGLDYVEQILQAKI